VEGWGVVVEPVEILDAVIELGLIVSAFADIKNHKLVSMTLS
jgi:hypothetical protein